MKYTILFFALLNVCSLSAQQSTDSLGGTVTFGRGLFVTYPNFQFGPNKDITTAHLVPPNHTILPPNDTFYPVSGLIITGEPDFIPLKSDSFIEYTVLTSYPPQYQRCVRYLDGRHPKCEIRSEPFGQSDPKNAMLITELPQTSVVGIANPAKKTVSGWSQHEQWRVKSYPMTNGKVLGFIGVAISGAIDGVVEGYEFDGRKSFERKYNVSPTGYLGSESWRRAYKNNDPDQGYKNLYARTFGANDFYHHADDARKIGYIGSGVVIGISGGRVNTKCWHYVADFGVGLAVSGAGKAAGMAWVRGK